MNRSRLSYTLLNWKWWICIPVIVILTVLSLIGLAISELGEGSAKAAFRLLKWMRS
jgi:hypothetical protein